MVKLRIFFLIWVFFLLGACSSDDETPQDSNISLNERVIDIDYGSSYQLNASFNRSGYPPNSLIWESSDDKVAT
jgi:hypothetical protein